MIPPSVPRNVEENLKMKTFAGDVRGKHVQAGTLTVTSGKVIAADAMGILLAEPFKVKIPAGEYPVILTLLRYPDDDERIAAARLQLRDGKVLRWQEAEPSGFAVDSGTAAFCDDAATHYLDELPSKQQKSFFDRVVRKVDEHYRETRSWVDLPVDRTAGTNLIAFSTGFGDGGYGAYLGYGPKNQPLSLLLDFGLLLTQEEIDDMAEQEPFED
jgi:hypothetical protein